jgi:hypothetical protein
VGHFAAQTRRLMSDKYKYKYIERYIALQGVVVIVSTPSEREESYYSLDVWISSALPQASNVASQFRNSIQRAYSPLSQLTRTLRQ